VSVTAAASAFATAVGRSTSFAIIAAARVATTLQQTTAMDRGSG
jgi:hypothetical protein